MCARLIRVTPISRLGRPGDRYSGDCTESVSWRVVHVDFTTFEMQEQVVDKYLLVSGDSDC